MNTDRYPRVKREEEELWTVYVMSHGNKRMVCKTTRTMADAVALNFKNVQTNYRRCSTSEVGVWLADLASQNLIPDAYVYAVCKDADEAALELARARVELSKSPGLNLLSWMKKATN